MPFSVKNTLYRLACVITMKTFEKEHYPHFYRREIGISDMLYKLSKAMLVSKYRLFPLQDGIITQKKMVLRKCQCHGNLHSDLSPRIHNFMLHTLCCLLNSYARIITFSLQWYVPCFVYSIVCISCVSPT